MLNSLHKAIAAIALAVLATGTEASAQTYPDKSIRLVVPFAPGGQTDLMARLLAENMSATLSQEIIVENISGSGGAIGAANVAKSDPDGYTLMLGTMGTQAVNPHIIPVLPYDPLKDFTPVVLIGAFPMVVVAHPSFEASTIAELIELTKTSPTPIQYATAGIGASGHLAAELLRDMTSINLAPVHYRGGAPMVTDIVGGHINLGFDALGTLLPHIQSGKMKALGISSANRDPIAPEIPTISETVPNYEANAWYNFVVPTGTPDDVVKTLNQAANAALNDAALSARLRELGINPIGGTPQEASDFAKSESEKWGDLVKRAKISVE